MDFEATTQFDASDKSTLIINVGGFRHETHVSTLKNFPDTRLCWIAENVSPGSSGKREIFYDRHPGAFTQILNYYRTGKLHYPTHMCGPMFEEELNFWGIDEKQMEPCCWTTYTKHREAEENLKAFVGPGFEDLKQGDLERSSSDLSEINERNDNFWRRIQPKIWNIMDEPYSSKLAKVVSYLSCFFISLSIAAFCASTLPGIRKGKDIVGNPHGLEILEIVCSSFFTLEFLVRVTFCPKTIEFFKKPMNWIDLISILPFYVSYFFHDLKVKMFSVIRVMRLFRFVKLSYGLQIMIHTLKASSRELVLLLLILLIPVIIFSSIVYYIEIMVNRETPFNSVPQSFWWCLITMTTVGYGDPTPETWPGKIIVGACAVCGVLIVALPISVIGSNFNFYYAHVQARLKLPVKQHRFVLGGVPGLLTKPQELRPRRKKKSTAAPSNLDTEMSWITERTSLRSSMPHSPLLELRRVSNRNAHDSETDLIGEEDHRSVSSPLLRPSPQLPPRGPIDKVILGSRRRPRRISGTLGPRKSVPEEVEPEDENTQQQNGTLPKDTAWIEPGTAEWNNTKLETDSILQPTSSDLNPESTELRGRACSPKVNGCVGMGTERPIIPTTDSLDPLGLSEKENDRAQWYVQDTNSVGHKEQASPFVVNRGIGSTCSSKRPSLASSKGSSEEMDSDQLHTLEIPMMRSFSVPSNTQRPLRSTPPPRKMQSQSTNICKRCSLPRETPNDYEDDNSKSLSGDVCCCTEKRAISGDTNNSTYTILIPGVDEGVQVSMESIPLWSRELPFHGGGSPIQLNVVPRLRRTVEDSDPENLPEQDEQVTVISELGSEHNGEETSKSPLLLIDTPTDLRDNETTI